jgi:hypothetical protein
MSEDATLERRRSSDIDISELKTLQQITIRQNARQFWMILVAVALGTAFIVTRETEWKLFKRSVIRYGDFVDWAGRTEKQNRQANNWESAPMLLHQGTEK